MFYLKRKEGILFKKHIAVCSRVQILLELFNSRICLLVTQLNVNYGMKRFCKGTNT